MSKKRKNGAGMLRKRSDGRWEARIVVGYNEKGLPITKNVTALEKAKCIEKLEMLRKEVGLIQRNTIKSDMNFGEWLDFWYRQYCKMTIRPTTQATYENRIYNHIIPEIGKIPLSKLTQNDLQQFYARLKKSGRLQYTDSLGEGLSDRMVRSCHGVCRTALDKAVQESLIRENPAIGCKLPPKKSREMQVLSPEEMQRFLIQARYDGYFEILLLALTTGMRRGEIMALQWDDLNLDTGELNIRRQVYYVKGEMIISEPKTKSSVRTIILPKSVVKVLAELKKAVKSRWMFPSPVKEDMPRNPHTVYKKMQLVLERSGCKKIRFHDLRHTFATTALANGMDVKTLSAIIGHVSAKTTLDIYLHSTDTMQRQAANKIDRGICKSKGISDNTESVPEESRKEPPRAKFEPVKGKYRKPGTGCITKINDRLYEGRYSPKGADGKRIARNIYAKTEKECEKLLAELIVKMKAEIQAEKEQIKAVR
jgi:integrase